MLETWLPPHDHRLQQQYNSVLKFNHNNLIGPFSTCPFREQIMAPWPQRCQGKLCIDTSTAHLLRRCITGSSAEPPPPSRSQGSNLAVFKELRQLFIDDPPCGAVTARMCVYVRVCVSKFVCMEAVKRKNKRRKMTLILKGSFMQHTLCISWQL